MPRHPADHVPTDFGGFSIDPKEPIVPQLYAALRFKILTLALKPGASVAETELAIAAGVSRTPARQVIKQLVGESLLNAYTSRGTFVARIDAKRLKEALIIRKRLEPFLAAERARDSNRSALVAKLGEILLEHKQALETGNIDQAYQIDEAFHKAICSSDGAGLIWQTVRQARTEADRLHALSRNRANSLEKALRHHEAIVDAIADGDPDRSYAAMDRHMQTNQETFALILTENPDMFA